MYLTESDQKFKILKKVFNLRNTKSNTQGTFVNYIPEYRTHIGNTVHLKTLNEMSVKLTHTLVYSSNTGVSSVCWCAGVSVYRCTLNKLVLLLLLYTHIAYIHQQDIPCGLHLLFYALRVFIYLTKATTTNLPVFPGQIRPA